LHAVLLSIIPCMNAYYIFCQQSHINILKSLFHLFFCCCHSFCISRYQTVINPIQPNYYSTHCPAIMQTWICWTLLVKNVQQCFVEFMPKCSCSLFEAINRFQGKQTHLVGIISLKSFWHLHVHGLLPIEVPTQVCFFYID